MTNTPEHWRERAEEARAMADGMKDATSKQTLFDIAKGYDRIAVQVEKLQKTEELLASSIPGIISDSN